MTEPGLQYRILDKALEMGEAGQWEDVRLHAVADALDISLDEVRMHYAQKDDLVEAWFDRADQAFKEKFDALKAYCTDAYEIGYEMMWQGTPED